MHGESKNYWNCNAQGYLRFAWSIINKCNSEINHRYEKKYKLKVLFLNKYIGSPH